MLHSEKLAVLLWICVGTIYQPTQAEPAFQYVEYYTIDNESFNHTKFFQ